jgi:hypothetical protein
MLVNAYLSYSGTWWGRVLINGVLILAVIVAAGCGSLSSRYQHLSIDSTPRGAVVKTAAGEPIGRTPLFHRQKRSPRLQFVTEFKDGPKAWADTPCRYPWVHSPLENLLVGLPGAVAGPVGFLGIWAAATTFDWWTGAAYNCPLTIRMTGGDAGIKYCPRYILLVPPKFNSTSRETLRTFWAKTFLKGDSCAQIIAEKKTLTWIRRLKVDFEKPGNLKQDRERLNRFGYETGATHLAQLVLSANDTEPAVLSSRILDLHTLQEAKTESIQLPSSIQTETVRSHSPVLGLLRESLSLIPETVAASITDRTLTVLPDSDLDFEEIQETRPGIKILSVSHPSAFDAWDMDFGFGPGFGIDVFESFRTKSDTNASVEFSRLSLQGIASVTGHTPLGALSLGLGIGGGYYYLPDSKFEKSHEFGSERIFQFTYTAFLTDAVMFRFFFEYTDPSASIAGGYFDSIIDNGLMFGYYFDQVDNYVRGLF